MRAGAALIAFFVGSVLRVRRAHVEQAMERAGVSRPARTATAMYRQLARSLLELLALAWSRRALPLTVEGEPDLNAALSDGQGVVIATAHTGNWDYVACAAAERVGLTVVTKHLSVGLLDRLWQRLRSRRGLGLVSAGQARARAARELAAGRPVAMLIDQAPERLRATTVVPFLGRAARVDLAPALLCLRARCPLVLVLARRAPGGDHVAKVAGVWRPPVGGRRDWAVQVMREATTALEAFVRRHPEQWLWMHRRWKDVGTPSLPTPDGISQVSSLRHPHISSDTSRFG